MGFLRLVLGRRLASHEQADQKIGLLAGVAALGLDGLASSAYGPEAVLAVLAALGTSAPHYVLPVVAVILALLTLVFLSYRQTIDAYPNGGGSYVVARENLGTNFGLLAAGALLLDYVLNVAVAISAGVAALISVFPSLHPYTLLLCLIILALITLMNLRGVSESATAFAIPTYAFVTSFAFILLYGLLLHPAPVQPPLTLPPPAESISLWLLLRAFSAGCTAMTGVEAVSNGVPIFKDPNTVHAKHTLTLIVSILAFLLASIAFLATRYHVGVIPQTDPQYQSLLSQIVAAIVGRGFFYYLAMASLLIVLALSANTSFVGFPRLCKLLAIDGFLPNAFTMLGRRLVYFIGISVLSLSAALLLILFDGITDHLIPLFAVGAFGAFTASQAGMVHHWLKDPHPNRLKIAINLVGALATGAALVVILITKFTHGAWVTFVILPGLLLLFRLIKRHYLRTQRAVKLLEPIDDLRDDQPPLVIIPTTGWDKLTCKSVKIALQLSPDVTAVHLSSLNASREETPADTHDKLRRDWREKVEQPIQASGLKPPRIEFLETPFRKFIAPLISFIERLEREHPGRQIAVVVPEVVKTHWWQYLLHGYRARQLKNALLERPDRRILLINVPWYLDE